MARGCGGLVGRALLAVAPCVSMENHSLQDAVRKAAPRIASHMNEDHSTSLRAYLGHYGGLPHGEYDVWMTDVRQDGFVLEYRVRDGTLTAPKHELVAPFPRPLTSASQVRAPRALHSTVYLHVHYTLHCSRAHTSGEDVCRRDAQRGLPGPRRPLPPSARLLHRRRAAGPPVVVLGSCFRRAARFPGPLRPAPQARGCSANEGDATEPRPSAQPGGGATVSPSQGRTI